MKFACDKCNTRYSIADERVRGRVLKIRCKACNHVITVREPEAPVADSLQSALDHFAGDDEHTRVSTAPPPPVSEGGGDEWYVSFDGEQEGPLPLARALDRVRTERPRGKECYCWRAGFFVWLPVEDVPEFAPALTPRAARPPAPPAEAAASPRAKSATGSQKTVKPGTGAQKVVKSATGSQAAVGRTTGSQAAVGRTTGSQAAAGRTTGSQAAAGRTTGSQAAVGRTTGSQAAVAARPAPASLPLGSLPPLEPEAQGLPEAPIPSLPTRPEPRALRKQEEMVPLPAADSGPPLSALAQALQVSQPAPNKPATADSGPVPLPPPPGSDLPIGEASGIVSLSHISKPSLATPQISAKPVVDTFGGVPVTPAALPTPGPQPVVVMSGPARGAPWWMKWAALAGGVATLALGVTVVVLMSRKPTVIVVPPAPKLDDGKKLDDHPITIADDPAPTPTATRPTPSGSRRGQKRPAAQAAARPAAAKGDNLTAAQRSLASLYRDGVEHDVPRGSPSLERGSHGGGADVSQQAILAVVTQNRRSLNQCYDRVLKHDSSIKSGRVVTHVKIGISGTVTGVSLPDPQYANSEIGQCIAQTVKRWHFPSADAAYEMDFPIILQTN